MNARGWAPLGLGLAAAVAAVGLVAHWESAALGVGRQAVLDLTIGALLLVALPILIAIARGRLDLFEPIVVVAGVWAMGYLLPAVLIASESDPTWVVWQDRARGETLALAYRALLLSSGGFIGVLVGYYGFGSPRGATAAPRPVDPTTVRRWMIFATLLIAGSFMVFVSRVGGPGILLASLNDRVRLFAGNNFLLLPVQALLGFVVYQWAARLDGPEVVDAGRGTGQVGRRRGRWSWGLALITIAVFTINTVNASKTTMLASLVALVVIRHYRYRAVGPALALALAGLGLMAGVAFDLYFREYLVLKELVSIDLSANLPEIVRAGWASLSRDAFLQLQTLMILLDGVPDRLPFQLGEPYLANFLAAIPRTVYPGKPPVGTEVFSRAFFEDLLAGGTSIPTSLVGEFYLNFGVVGIVVGCVVVGVLLRAGYSWLRRNRARPEVVTTYAFLCGSLMPWIRGDTFGPTVFFLSAVVPMWLIVGLSRDRSAASLDVRNRGISG
jgi:hypothetical protein